MTRLGHRTRLFLILALFALVPATVVTVIWGTAVGQLLPLMAGTAAWDSANATGARAMGAARRAPLDSTARRLLAEHERELAESQVQSRRFGFLTRQATPALALVGVVVVVLLGYVASRVAGHLSRQLSRPLDELVGWTGRIAREEPLPSSAEAGAPEFAVLRAGMRRMADELERGRRAALETERAAAYRESARRFAHELKNPLTPIRFAVARLQRDTPPELVDTVEVLAAEAARLEGMARSFAQYGRLPEGPVAEVDLGELAREVVRRTVPATHPCSVEVAPGTPTVRGQYDALDRALVNVVQNALESSGEGAPLQVRVGPAADGLVAVAVRDAGCGIPAEALPRIWAPYVTSKGGGTGLGLAIVKQTIEAHGGRVTATSEPGVGTEVTMALPGAPSGGTRATD